MKGVACGTALIAALATSLVLALPPNGQRLPRLGGPLVDGSVARAKDCGNHFFIAVGSQYSLAEWLGGEMVKETDVLQANDDQGSFEREGRMSVTNLATGAQVEIVIEKALLNRANYVTVVKQVCR